MNQDFRTGNSRRFAEIFAAIDSAFAISAIDYCIMGAIALGLHGYERYSDEIEILLPSATPVAIAKTIESSLTSKIHVLTAGDQPYHSIQLTLKVSSSHAMDCAIKLSSRVTFFGNAIPIISAEFLVWSYLQDSEARPHLETDALDLIGTPGAVNLATLAAYFDAAGDDAEKEKLLQLLGCQSEPINWNDLSQFPILKKHGVQNQAYGRRQYSALQERLVRSGRICRIPIEVLKKPPPIMTSSHDTIAVIPTTESTCRPSSRSL